MRHWYTYEPYVTSTQPKDTQELSQKSAQIVLRDPMGERQGAIGGS